MSDLLGEVHSQPLARLSALAGSVMHKTQKGYWMFEAVTEEEFTRVEGKRPEYLAIGGYLQEIAGGGWDGVSFKTRVLREFGWPHDHERYYENPALAADVFNRVADAIRDFEKSHSKPLNALKSKVLLESKHDAFVKYLNT